MRDRPLHEQQLDPDPLRQFAAWYREAEEAGLELPEAVALATATRDGAPSVRMVLLKGFDERGFVFYTGYESRKGGELARNPRAALLFYWHPLGRQVRIEGAAEPVGEDEADAYFATRPPGSRFSAAAWRQGEPVASREELEARVASLRARLGEDVVPRPVHWGGYRVDPDAYEFWQHREDRLHDRFRYLGDGRGGWRAERLAP